MSTTMSTTKSTTMSTTLCSTTKSTTHLLSRVHELLPLPEGCLKVSTVRGEYQYWHYCCDATDDRGWGCGYRTLQTIISWLLHNTTRLSSKTVPSLRLIQELLVNMEDKPTAFLDSRQWIGSVEVGLVIDSYCDVPCKIIHVASGSKLSSVFSAVCDHLEVTGCPIMMGGDRDASSKGIFGACTTQSGEYFLIVDPHYVSSSSLSSSPSSPSSSCMVRDQWVQWVSLRDFQQDSFYNLCLPQVRSEK